MFRLCQFNCSYAVLLQVGLSTLWLVAAVCISSIMKIKDLLLNFCILFLCCILGLPLCSIAAEENITPERGISLVQADPVEPEWKNLWDTARELVRQKRFKEGVKQYAALIELKPNIEEAVWEYCGVLLKTGELDTAFSNISVLLEKKPNNLQYLLTAGSIAMARKEYQQAMQYFGKVYEKSPLGSESEVALDGLAHGLLLIGREASAYPLLEELWARRPGSHELLRELALTGMALGYKEKSRVWLSKLLEQPDVDDRLLLKAVDVFNRPEDEAKRRQLWLAYLGKHPDYLPFRVELYRSWKKTGEYDKSLDQLTELINRSAESGEFQLEAAQLCISHLNRPDLALNYFEQYLSSHPQDKTVRQKIKNLRMVLANDFLSIVENNGAWLLWRDLAHIAPNRVEIYKNMATLLEEKGKIGPLIEILEIIGKQDPRNAGNFVRLANMYKKQGQTRKALASIEKIPAELRSKSKEISLLEGQLALGLGKEITGLDAFLHVLVLDPENQQLRQQCMELAGELGNVSVFKKLFQDAVAKHEQKIGLQFVRTYLMAVEKNYLYAEYERVWNWFTQNLTHGSEDFVRLSIDHAGMLMRKGRLRDAEQELRIILNHGHLQEEILSLLAEIAVEEREFIAAQDWLGALQKLDVESGHLGEGMKSDTLRLRILLIHTKILKGQGRYAEALAEVPSDISPQNKNIHKVAEKLSLQVEKQVCWLLFYQGEREKALKNAQKMMHRAFDAELFVMLHIFSGEDKQSSEKALQKWLAPFGYLMTSRLRKTIGAEIRFREYSLAEKHLNKMLEQYPDSLCGRVQRLRLDFLSGKVQEGNRQSELLEKEMVGEPYVYNLHIENFISHGQYERALAILLEKEQVPTAGDLILKFSLGFQSYDQLRLARILWGIGSTEKALELYRQLLEPSVLQILQDEFLKAKIGFVVPGSDEGFWSSMVQLLSVKPDVIDEIMAPDFLINNLGNKTGRIVAQFFGQYRRQKIVSNEYRARKAIYEKNYYYAEQSYRKLKQEERSVSTMIDLAGIYGRLGRPRKEAQVYEELQSEGNIAPELESSIARSSLQLSPRLTVELEQSAKSGRDGAVDIKKNGVGSSFWITPSLDKDMRVQFENSRFSSDDPEESISSNRLMGEALVEFGGDYELFGTFGLEKFNFSSDTEPVYSAGIRGQLDDYVGGFIQARKELVYDTLSALRQGIYSQGFQTGLEIETVFGVRFGGDVGFSRYSDDNSKNLLHLFTAYRVFSDVNEWTLQYDYHYEANDSSDQLDKDGPAEDIYWHPASFYDHLFSFNVEHNFGKVMGGGSGKSFIRFKNGVGVETDSNLIYKGSVDIFLEMSTHYLLKGNFLLSTSEAYEEIGALLSLQYRW